MIVVRVERGEIDGIEWQVDREVFSRRLRKGHYGSPATGETVQVASGPPWPAGFTGIALIDGHFVQGSALDFWRDVARRSG